MCFVSVNAVIKRAYQLSWVKTTALTVKSNTSCLCPLEEQKRHLASILRINAHENLLLTKKEEEIKYAKENSEMKTLVPMAV